MVRLSCVVLYMWCIVSRSTPSLGWNLDTSGSRLKQGQKRLHGAGIAASGLALRLTPANSLTSHAGAVRCNERCHMKEGARRLWTSN